MFCFDKLTGDYSTKNTLTNFRFVGVYLLIIKIRDGPFDIRGGGGAGIFLKRIDCFPIGAKK